MREMDGENKPQIPLHSTHLSMNTLTWLFQWLLQKMRWKERS